MADKTPEQLMDELENITEQLKAAGVNVGKFASRSLKSIEDRFKDLDKIVKKSGGSYKDAITQLGALKDAIEDDVEGIQTARQKRDNLDNLEKRARQAYNETLNRAGKQLVGTVVSGFANYYVNQLRTGIRSLMWTGSPFQMATDLQVQGYEDINKTLQGVAGGAEAAGQTLLMIPHPAARVAGGLLMLGGALTSFLSSKTTEYFTEKTRILGAEVEKTYNSFMQAAAAGALYAGGVTELRKIALQSGLTQEQFTKVISDSRHQLAEAGYGISEGTRIVGRVTQRFATDIGKSGKTLQREMLNLGFSIDDQATLVAETLANIRRVGGDPNDARAVATATAEYAKNLRLIAELTGDDAKKRMADAKGVTDEYSFQKKFLREHNGDMQALQDAQAAISLLTIDQQRAVHQAYVRGAVTNIPSIIAGFRDPALALANTLHQTKFNASEFQNITAQYNNTVLTENDARKEAIASSTVLVGKNGELSKALGDSMNNARAFNTESLARSRTELNKAAATPDTFTGSLNDSVIALQNMRNTIQTDLTGAIMKFADGVPKILADFRKKLVEVGILDEKSTYTPGPGQLFQKRTDESTEDYNKRTFELNRTQDMLSKMGKARGGISDGPLSGYGEILHGREAVVPLPSGDQIPVEFKNAPSQLGDMQDLVSEIKHGNHSMTAKLDSILAVMQQNNKLTSGILQHTM